MEAIIPGLHAGPAGCLHLAGADSGGSRALPVQAALSGGGHSELNSFLVTRNHGGVSIAM